MISSINVLRYRLSAGGSIEYVFLPGSEPFVMLHGLLGFKEHYYPLMEEFHNRGKGCLAIDLFGFGRSSHLAQTEEYSFKRQADAIAELLKNRMPKTAWSLICHSMSSCLIPELVAQCRDSIARIILLEGNLFPEHALFSKKIIDMSVVEFNNFFKSVMKTYGFVLSRQLRKNLSKSEFAVLTGNAGHMDPNALQKTARLTYEASVSGSIEKALNLCKDTVPVQYLYGERSDVLTLTSRITAMGISVIRIPDAGHYLMIDNAAMTAAAILD